MRTSLPPLPSSSPSPLSCPPASSLHQIETQRPEEMARCAAGIQASFATQARLGFATNLGDAGYGALGVGLCSRLRHGPRALIFNCAVPSTRVRPKELVDSVGPRLVELVRNVERTAGLI